MAGERWTTVVFQDLIDARQLEIGDGYRAKNNELGGNGPLFLRAGHVTDTHINFNGVERFCAELADRVRPKMASDGDTIVTTKGNSTGRTSYVTSQMPPFVYSPHLSYWRSLDHSQLVPGFLRYWSQGMEFAKQLQGMKASTDMAPYLSLTDQRRLQITLPPARDQRAIAHILGTLDDKIELNRRMNETLEAMARAIFKSWFVDFNPVRATVAELCDEGILEIGDGYRAKNSELGSEGLPFARASNLNSGFNLDGAECLCPASVAKTGGKISQLGDVAFTSKGTVGRIARVDNSTPQFVYAPQVCFWRSKNPHKLHPTILYCWMSSDDFGSQVRSFSGQTDMAPYISLCDQRRIVVPRFPTSQAALGHRIETLLNRKALCASESRTLVALRESLLPRLLSGDLVIAHASIFMRR